MEGTSCWTNGEKRVIGNERDSTWLFSKMRTILFIYLRERERERGEERKRVSELFIISTPCSSFFSVYNKQMNIITIIINVPIRQF